MKDQNSLQFCLQEVEKKLNWGESSSWKESEFSQLSKIIFNKTDISISPQTLKRLYGKIKYNEYYNPQRATKDALGIFLGFADWTDFKTYFNENVKYNEQQKKQNFWKRKPIKGTLIFSMAILSMLIILVILKENFIEESKPMSFSFDIADTVAFVPYTVFVEYNIKEFSSDSNYLDFDFIHPITGPEIKKLDKQQSLNNFTYQIPGYYNVSLKSDGRKIAYKNVLAVSENWDSYFFPEANPRLWLDNKIKPNDLEGQLYYSPEYLGENGFDLKSVFFVNHQLFKNFKIDGDNFEMKVRFKNSKETGGITCYDFLTNLHSEKNLSYFRLMESGCSGYSGIKVGDTEVTGIEKNLSSITFNKENWNNLHVIVRNNKVVVLINHQVVFSDNYQGFNGQIVGLEYRFKGTGTIDYIILKDLGTNQEFFDNFD